MSHTGKGWLYLGIVPCWLAFNYSGLSAFGTVIDIIHQWQESGAKSRPPSWSASTPSTSACAWCRWPSTSCGWTSASILSCRTFLSEKRMRAKCPRPHPLTSTHHSNQLQSNSSCYRQQFRWSSKFLLCIIAFWQNLRFSIWLTFILW